MSESSNSIQSVLKRNLPSVPGTTIPAGTAVMTGTAAGVGAFMKPKSFLRDGDIVEVEMANVGTLTNKIRFK
jgi:2-keto-4-pentenoate hydratase/2-oxohepta-3-ene-1,7-dioic acid hydratase in catechol pathway